jgi:hypothetical protein
MEGRLAESGSGPVYRARDTSGRILAIKVLEGPLDPELPDRLRAEADLKHDNILPILDLFQNSVRVGIVMELLEGHTLREMIAEDESASLEERVEIMTRAGEALRYANANGVVHRGLKPSRIHVLPDGSVKVRGFSVDDVAGEPVDSASNIFSYGVVLDELTAHCEDRPALLESIIERATHHDRDARYQNFDELLADAARLLVELRKTDLHFSGLFEAAAPAGPDPTAEPVREDARFAVHRPRSVRSGEWQTLLAYAYWPENAADAPEGEVTFVPRMNGVEFNPRRVSFQWEESVHEVSFRMRASASLDGQTARGQMCVYWGSILMAQVPLAIEVGSAAEEEDLVPVTTSRYRKVFACYSHRDLAVVEEVERYSQAMGDEYLRELIHLRSGEVWNERLMRMMEQADVFELFWSSQSMRSPFARQEWEYALALNRDAFVRPVYWEEPLRDAPAELRSLVFHRVGLRTPDPPVAAVAVAAAAGAGARAAVAARPGPPPLPARPSVPVWTPPPAAREPEPRRLGMQWAAALLIVFGFGGLGWYAFESRKPAPVPVAVATPVPDTPDPDPVPAAKPPAATVEPAVFAGLVQCGGQGFFRGQPASGLVCERSFVRRHRIRAV